jgi:acetylornithine deacetylase/succinyl-diaminopimelate desuccinylase-like protein
MKSFRPKDGSGEPPVAGRNGELDFRGAPRGNETHASTTDPDARLYKKAAGQASKLCHMGHVLMENRHGLVVDTAFTVLLQMLDQNERGAEARRLQAVISNRPAMKVPCAGMFRPPML